MSKVNSILNFLNHFKYLIVIVVGIVCVGFVGNSSFLNLARMDAKISDINAEIAQEKANDADSKRQLQELQDNPKYIEHVAREKYMMKEEDEDIFVLNSDLKNKKASQDEETE